MNNGHCYRDAYCWLYPTYLFYNENNTSDVIIIELQCDTYYFIDYEMYMYNLIK
jgi:hypothetical protein